MALEHGSVRQIWLAKQSDIDEKWSFLVNDESTTKTGAVFGRTLRLGDPVSTGPDSVWLQKTWEGGSDQQVWQDPAMYDNATADVFSDRGRARLQLGFKKIHGHQARGITGWASCPSTLFHWQSVVNLYIGERNTVGGHYYPGANTDPTTGTVQANGGFLLQKYNPSTGAISTITTVSGSITNIIPYRDQDGFGPEGWLAVFVTDPLTQSSSISWLNIMSDTFYSTETLHTGLYVYPYAAVPWGDGVVYGVGNELRSRVWTTGAVNTLIKRFPGSYSINGMTVWNNRLWFAVQNTNGTCALWVSDGTTCTEVLSFNQPFWVYNTVAHYGSLYLVGVSGSTNPTASGQKGQVWRYNGSSLTKLYEEGDGRLNEDRAFSNLASWGKYLVWGRPGTASRPNAGLMLYDPDLDAICEGPNIEMDAGGSSTLITSVDVYGSELLVSMWDMATYAGTSNIRPSMLSLVRIGGEVRHSISGYESRSFQLQPSTLSQYVKSSRYDGEPGVETEEKVWVTGKLRCKVPSSDTSIIVKAVLDEASSETTVTTISYDSENTGWRTVSFPVKEGGAGEYLRSQSIRYVVYLTNSAASADSTATPEVDFVAVSFQVAAQKRRSWGMRVIVSDDQDTLAGDPNPLATSAALEDKLEELFFERTPVYFWEATAESAEPDNGDAIEATIGSWSNPSWRVSTEATEVAGEVSLTLVEVAS